MLTDRQLKCTYYSILHRLLQAVKVSSMTHRLYVEDYPTGAGSGRGQQHELATSAMPELWPRSRLGVNVPLPHPEVVKHKLQLHHLEHQRPL